MKNIWRYILILASVLLLGMIVIFNRAFFVAYFINPITTIVWFLMRLIKVVDQQVLWFMLVFLVFTVALLILPAGKEDHYRSAYRTPSRINNRLAFWETQIHSADRDVEGRQTLQKDLQSLMDTFNESAGPEERTPLILAPLSQKPWHIISRITRSFLGSLFKNGETFRDGELERELQQIFKSLETEIEKQNEQSPTQLKNR